MSSAAAAFRANPTPGGGSSVRTARSEVGSPSARSPAATTSTSPSPARGHRASSSPDVQGARGRSAHDRPGSATRRRGLALHHRGTRSGQRVWVSQRGLPGHRSRLRDARHGAGALGPGPRSDRQQRERRSAADAQRVEAPGTRSLPRCLPGRDRQRQRPGVPDGQQRRLPGRLRQSSGRLRGGLRPSCSPASTGSSSAWAITATSWAPT